MVPPGRNPPPPPPDAVQELVRYYRRNGFVRWPLPERMEEEDAQSYKKGAEIRFTAHDADEAERIMELLQRIGMRHGRPFAKGAQFRIPVYGYSQVADFLAFV